MLYPYSSVSIHTSTGVNTSVCVIQYIIRVSVFINLYCTPIPVSKYIILCHTLFQHLNTYVVPYYLWLHFMVLRSTILFLILMNYIKIIQIQIKISKNSLIKLLWNLNFTITTMTSYCFHLKHN